jgi:DNA excision repair protein ERCC-6
VTCNSNFKQADQLIAEEADERDKRMLQRLQITKDRAEEEKADLVKRSKSVASQIVRSKIEADILKMNEKIQSINNDIAETEIRRAKRQDEAEALGGLLTETSGTTMLPNETTREYLIRTGKITPFSREYAAENASLAQKMELEVLGTETQTLEPVEETAKSHQHLRRPGFEDEFQPKRQNVSQRVAPSRPVASKSTNELSERSRKRRRLEGTSSGVDSADISADDFVPSPTGSPEVYSPEPVLDDDLDGLAISEAEETHASTTADPLSGIDDGDERVYKARLTDWVKRRSAARKAANAHSNGEEEADPDSEADDVEEWHQPHPTIGDIGLDDGLYIPGDIHPSLFNYQKIGVQWLWELYTQNVGGIVGDEMGLGKTIQMISFLASLQYSKKLTGPIIVVTPATVMKQWVNEFHTWWPAFRVSVLHTSGSGMVKRSRGDVSDSDDAGFRPTVHSQPEARRIVRRVVEEGHVLITTYTGLRTYGKLLIPVDWGFAVLDEGHKIRNPNTEVTLYCKQLRTPHRVILSGTPMQNNLTELWSLFDFVFPMRLGNLLSFREHFEIPIRLGGYANATNLQIQVATKCAETLKDAISPYLLQRLKVDVAADLPKKTEQVIFCKLTALQRKAYENYLKSDDCNRIFNGKLNTLRGVDILRKICNHPDLEDRGLLMNKGGYDYGAPEKSGKLLVVKALVQMFKKFSHRTLLFCQTRIMLDIVQKFVSSLDGFKFRRMDGTTPITQRQTLVNEFNENETIDIFLLTTKVGGLGVNLTGADRVIIFDPDWNPSTDVQARERAWRLGQKKQVAIYRLMTAGTIEEKIYHRQIFKQFLTNKVMKDPTQRRTFQMTDLHDLFTLAPEGNESETAQMFSEAKVTYREEDKPKSVSKNRSLKGKQAVSGTDGKDDSSKEPQDTVSNLNGVSYLENLGNDKAGANGEPANGSEDRLMQGIFARSGVHSALEHEEILNNHKVRPDAAIVDREARRIASIAAAELTKNERNARELPSGTPTWTGEFGVAGRPEERRPKPRGPSSSLILAGLQNKTNVQIAAGSSSDASTSSDPRTAGYKAKALMKKIQEFFRIHGGRVVSQMILDHFTHQCKTPEETARFMACLKEVANMDKKKGGRGAGRAMWTLKEEWK